MESWSPPPHDATQWCQPCGSAVQRIHQRRSCIFGAELLAAIPPNLPSLLYFPTEPAKPAKPAKPAVTSVANCVCNQNQKADAPL